MPSPSPSPSPVVTNLDEFLNSVPYSLTFVLVQLAPLFSFARNTGQVLSWTSSSYHSWLALAAWWALCLLAHLTIRYFLPIAVILTLAVTASSRNRSLAAPPVTENTLQAAITDLTTIQSLIPTNSTIAPTSPSLSVLLRVAAILYLPYLLLTYYVPIRILVGLAGSVAISYNASWAAVIYNTLAKSAWVRWFVYSAWSKLSGQPLPSRNMSYQTIASSNAIEPSASLRFIFTIYENHRWWMGLDWTAALLPGERPSWCSSSLQPVSPPNAFVLPEPTTVYLRDSQGKRVKRTATWKWEEPEWKVLIRKEDGAINRVEKPLPTTKEENPGLLMKAAGKMKEVNSPTSPGTGEGDHHVAEKDQDHVEDEDIPTDLDGWVYGDNKWEAKSSKGGMGKYTRYRRWTRVAVVNETVQAVEDGETGIDRGRGRTSVSKVTVAPAITASPEGSPESPLRQRLKSALTKGTS